MKEPLISIVIPIYNDEKYVEATINDICHQDYQNLEIICVDDGSTDKTPEILKKLSENDPRIKLIFQKNQGHCQARNTGLKIAKGEYITFIDHDDQIHPQMISVLYRLLIENQSDISVVNYKLISGDNIIKEYKRQEINPKKIKKYYGTDTILANALIMEKFGYASWNKLFKMDIVSKMPNFPDVYDVTIGSGEDALFLFKYIELCQSLVYLKQNYYFYRIFKSSLSHIGMNKDTFTQIKIFNYLRKFDKINFPISQVYIDGYISVAALVILLRVAKTDYQNKKQLNYIYKHHFLDKIKGTQKGKLQPWFRRYFMWVTVPIVRFKLRGKL